jgi:NADH-quinone oxidoreductase subunit L
MADVLYLIPLLPLLGAIVCGVFHALGGGWKDRAGYVASAAVAGSFVVALLAFFAIPSGHGEGHEGAASLVYVGWTWLDIGVLQVPFKLVIDPLSGFMALVVTGVGLLIHIYSIGYIAHDECRAKFFAFLNLFIVSMSILILGASMPLLFVGWEGVGVMSYLLIGFWYENGWPAEAGQKAFITNRIGDAGFLIGMFLLIQLFGTLDFGDRGAGPSLEAGLASTAWRCRAALFGAAGQVRADPAVVWLPDAMAGPTPVSALIHAATMVTAGVYLVVRLSSALRGQSPTAMLVVATVGRDDRAGRRDDRADAARPQEGPRLLHRQPARLHVPRARRGRVVGRDLPPRDARLLQGLLFLGAGSVIHGMHEEQDMLQDGRPQEAHAGDLDHLLDRQPRARRPAAHFAASSRRTRSSAYTERWAVLRTFRGPWIIGAITAALTAFYTWRMVGLTFFGKERFDPAKVHPHESPLSMTGPLMVLALLSVARRPARPAPVSATSCTCRTCCGDWLEPVTAPGELLLAQRWATTWRSSSSRSARSSPSSAS